MVNNVLVFCPSQLQFLQLDLSKKQLITTASLALPPGVIQRGKITDLAKAQAAVVEILKKAVVPFHKISVVIPEDSVISKSLELPNEVKKEINEAVRWEAESFLHFPLDEAVLDWKTLFTNGKYHILFQAIPLKIVDDYLKTLESTELEVSRVSTPALAMTKLAEEKPGVRLLIYVTATEAILTLAKDEEVVATSIVPINQKMDEMIKQTVVRMGNYYQDFPIAWIQVGGIGVNNQMIKVLQTLKLPVTGFNIPITAKPEVANNYLLAISAAVVMAQPPSDQQSINLLPSWYLGTQKRQTQTKFWKYLLLVLAIFNSTIAIFTITFYLWLNNQEAKFLAQQNQPSVVTKEALESASTANRLSQLVTSLSISDNFPTHYTQQILNVSGDQVKLAKIELSVPEKKATLVGIANDRAAMLAFKQNLEELPGVAGVQLPISSFVEETNILFQLFVVFSQDLTRLPEEEIKNGR